MGSYHSTYMGPYLEVPHAEQEKTEQPTYICTANKKHGGKWGMKFCPDCGAPVDTNKRTVTKVAPVDVYDVCENVGTAEVVWQPASLADAASRDAFGIWVSNYGDVCRDLEETGVVCLSGTDPSTFADDTAEFTQRLQPAVDAIREKFGVEAVVKYGIVSYYS